MTSYLPLEDAGMAVYESILHTQQLSFFACVRVPGDDVARHLSDFSFTS